MEWILTDYYYYYYYYHVYYRYFPFISAQNPFEFLSCRRKAYEKCNEFSCDCDVDEFEIEVFYKTKIIVFWA